MDVHHSHDQLSRLLMFESADENACTLCISALRNAVGVTTARAINYQVFGASRITSPGLLSSRKPMGGTHYYSTTGIVARGRIYVAGDDKVYAFAVPTASTTPTPSVTPTATITATPSSSPTPRLSPTPRARPTPVPRPQASLELKKIGRPVFSSASR